MTYEANHLHYQDALNQMGSLDPERLLFQWIIDHPEVTDKLLSIMGSMRERIVPLFEAYEVAEGVVGKVTETAMRLKRLILNEREVIGHSPRRIESPTPNTLFQRVIEGEERSPYQEAIHYIVGCSNFDSKRRKNQLRKKFIVERGTTLTLEAYTPDSIDGCEMRVRNVDDQFENFPYEEIIEQAKDEKRKVIVSLSGIQTSQYPRALHIAIKLRAMASKAGLAGKVDILFGGFHIMGHEESREEIMKYGFTAVNDWADDGRLGNILRDAVHQNEEGLSRLKPLYETINERGKRIMPTLTGNALIAPTAEKVGQHSIVMVQLSRGCPFDCSFCSVAGIDGRKVLSRTAEEAEVIFRHLHEQGMHNIFITDDNFYRNKNKTEILDMLIRLKQEGIHFEIMMQVDLKVTKATPRSAKASGSETKKGPELVDFEFMDKCREAGVYMIFAGLESYVYEVLKAMGKTQNMAGGEEGFLRHMGMQIAEWHKRGIGTNCTCIIGNKEDPEGVGEKSATAALKIAAGVVSLFIRTFLPGSRDFEELDQNDGIEDLDYDFNQYGAGIATFSYKEGLKKEQIQEEFRKFFDSYYQARNIKNACKTLPTVYQFALTMLLVRVMGSERVMERGLGKVYRAERVDSPRYEQDKQVCLDYTRTGSQSI